MSEEGNKGNESQRLKETSVPRAFAKLLGLVEQHVESLTSFNWRSLEGQEVGPREAFKDLICELGLPDDLRPADVLDLLEDLRALSDLLAQFVEGLGDFKIVGRPKVSLGDRKREYRVQLRSPFSPRSLPPDPQRPVTRFKILIIREGKWEEWEETVHAAALKKGDTDTALRRATRQATGTTTFVLTTNRIYWDVNSKFAVPDYRGGVRVRTRPNLQRAEKAVEFVKNDLSDVGDYSPAKNILPGEVGLLAGYVLKSVKKRNFSFPSGIISVTSPRK